MFVDNAVVHVKAGDGGGGIVSFRRERYVAKGGPDGGDGGDGGNVVFIGSNNQNTLANFRFQKELKAEDGSNGSNAKRHGKNGKDLEVPVPVGTMVLINGKVAFDITEHGQREIVATGGKGGFGNAHFTSSVRQAPRIAEKGDPGEEFEAELELKMIADVGLVGLPNAGKSTLLSKISGAKPKIANYPFTTLNPHLGVVRVGDGDEMLMADIPGLIDGASDGKGLGDEFLRHIERTAVLLHMIDVYGDHVDEDYKTIVTELKNYKVDLSKKPQIIALTKIEGLDQDIVQDQMQKLTRIADGAPVYAISALSGVGLQELLFALQAAVQHEKNLQAEAEHDAPVVIGLDSQKRDTDAWTVEYMPEEGYVVVRGAKIERFANRTDFESADAVGRLRDIMRKSGILHEFERQEVEPGVHVVFGDNREDYMEY